MKQIPGGVTAPKGFTASGVHCGVKKGKGDGNQPPMSKMPEVLEGKKDLALIVSEQPCVAAAVYTMNRVKAAPLYVTMDHLENGEAQAIVANSGNANACAPNSHEHAETMCQLAQEKPELVAITAAMQSGTGLSGFAKAYPNRFFDVGIAEGHAVAMTAGLAKQGALPVFAVYSSFLQRGYDMLIHDLALLKLHGILAVDRAGLVGEDGETHHGVFDVAFLSTVPGMQILCPASYAELRAMLRHAVLEMSGPVAIRYPRGGEGAWTGMAGVEGTRVLQEGADITLVAYGVMVDQVLQAARLLEQRGYSATVVKLNSIRPLDLGPILQWSEKTGRLLVAEECNDTGSVGRAIASELALQGRPVKLALVNLGDGFVPQGSVAQLREMKGIDAEGICKKAMEMITGG